MLTQSTGLVSQTTATLQRFSHHSSSCAQSMTSQLTHGDGSHSSVSRSQRQDRPGAHPAFHVELRPPLHGSRNRMVTDSQTYISKGPERPSSSPPPHSWTIAWSRTVRRTSQRARASLILPPPHSWTIAWSRTVRRTSQRARASLLLLPPLIHGPCAHAAFPGCPSSYVPATVSPLITPQAYR